MLWLNRCVLRAYHRPTAVLLKLAVLPKLLRVPYLPIREVFLVLLPEAQNDCTKKIVSFPRNACSVRLRLTIPTRGGSDRSQTPKKEYWQG